MISKKAIEAACEAQAIAVAKQDGVVLTTAGFRHGATTRPHDHDQMREYVAAGLEAALPFLPIAVEVPEGWQLVPIEPTDAMRDAADSLPHETAPAVYYNAMIAAAPSSPGKDGGQEVEAVTFPDVVSWSGNVHDRDTALTGLANYLEDCCKFNPVRGRQIWAMQEAAKLLRFFAEKSPLYTRPQPASTALVERLQMVLERLITAIEREPVVGDLDYPHAHNDWLGWRKKILRPTASAAKAVLSTSREGQR